MIYSYGYLEREEATTIQFKFHSLPMVLSNDNFGDGKSFTYSGATISAWGAHSAAWRQPVSTTPTSVPGEPPGNIPLWIVSVDETQTHVPL